MQHMIQCDIHRDQIGEDPVWKAIAGNPAAIGQLQAQLIAAVEAEQSNAVRNKVSFDTQ